MVEFKNEETITMKKYLKDVKDTLEQLETMHVKILEDLIILLLLNSLSNEY